MEVEAKVLGSKGELVLKAQRIHEIRKARSNCSLPSLHTFVCNSKYVISVTNMRFDVYSRSL